LRVSAKLRREPALHGALGNGRHAAALHGLDAALPHGTRGLVVDLRRVGNNDAFDLLRMASSQRLSRHAAHAQTDKMHRTKALGLDQRGHVVGEHVNAVRPLRCLRLAMTTVVVAQHGVAALQQGGHRLPHREVAAQGVTEHDDRALPLLD